MRYHGWRRRLLAWAAVLAVVALSAVACGLPVDTAPREIGLDSLDPELRPGQLPTPTPGAPSEEGPGRNQIFMIQNSDPTGANGGTNRLVAVERQIVDTPERLIEILLQGTFPSESAEGIGSALSRSTRVQSVVKNDLFPVVTVDLAPGSLDPQNSEQRLAFAQFVYTLTSLDDIESVQFVQSDPNDPSAPPTPLSVQKDDGTSPPGARVGRADFALLDPQPVPGFDLPVATPTPTPDPNAEPLFELAVWMLDEQDQLVRVPRRIERTPEGHLVALVGGVTADEDRAGIRSAIPPDALVISVDVAQYDVVVNDFGFANLVVANIANVNLAPGSLPPIVDIEEQYLAIAQMVFTLTDLEEIDQVVFSVDGEPIPVPTDRGSTPGERPLSLPFEPNITSGLTKQDFASAAVDVLPTPTPVAPIGPIVTPTPTPTPS